jgi:hypothetical protein
MDFPSPSARSMQPVRFGAKRGANEQENRA